MSLIRQYIQRQRDSIDRHVGQKRIDGGQSYRQRLRSNENLQRNPFTRDFFVCDRIALRHPQRNNICLTQRNSLHWRRRIRFCVHLPGLVWNNSRLQRIHSTRATPTQLNCDVSVNLRRRNYAAGTRVSTSGYVSPIQMILISQGKPSITTTLLTEFFRRVAAHEDRSCSRHNRRRRGRHARRSHHAAERMAALKRRVDRLPDHRMGLPDPAAARHRAEHQDVDQAVSALS
jgi:hypothetical protein